MCKFLVLVPSVCEGNCQIEELLKSFAGDIFREANGERQGFPSHQSDWRSSFIALCLMVRMKGKREIMPSHASFS